MSLQNRPLIRHFNAYHQTDSLLFQFILSEFLDAYLEIQHHLVNKSSIEELHAGLAKLAGSLQDYMRFFPWNHDHGLLVKLKNYCALFSQNSENEKDPAAMQQYADKAWHACIEALKISHTEACDQNLIVAFLGKAYSALQRMARLIARLLPQFRDDENVIFFLLRYHQQFDLLYGSKFVVKLLGRMFPQGLQETGHFLSKKYGLRGFDNLVPLVTAKISELEGIHC